MGGLFHASEGTLATKMMTIASTILLLQEMSNRHLTVAMLVMKYKFLPAFSLEI